MGSPKARRGLLASLLALAWACGGGVAEARTLVTYSAAGGIAGIQTKLVVETDGDATLTSSRARQRETFKLNLAKRRALRAAIKRADLPRCKARYAPKIRVADGITRSVRAGGRTVVVEDGARDVPKRLSALLERLASLSP